jgi:Zn-dependent M28 family amino/carboxypeptidase
MAAALMSSRMAIAAVAIAVAPLGCARWRYAGDVAKRAETRALAALRTETIRDVTRELSAPAMEGRDTGARGGTLAAEYIAARLAASGIKSAGDSGGSSYLQRFSVRDSLTTQNVIGIVEGTDPVATRQAIVFMAHYDAFGIGSDGRIRAGAADNALGVGMLLAVADAVARSGATPKRSIIFLATTGEERGMLGAKHWADHPVVPLDRVVAALNFDGVGTEVFGPVQRVVGFGADLSDLGDVLAGVERELHLQPEADPFGSVRPFYHSDHIILARRGVPSLMLLGLPADSVAASMRRARAWLASSYHQSGDTIRADWDWSGPRTIAAVALLTGLRVANADAAPAWRDGAPFARLKADAGR